MPPRVIGGLKGLNYNRPNQPLSEEDIANIYVPRDDMLVDADYSLPGKGILGRPTPGAASPALANMLSQIDPLTAGTESGALTGMLGGLSGSGNVGPQPSSDIVGPLTAEEAAIRYPAPPPEEESFWDKIVEGAGDLSDFVLDPLGMVDTGGDFIPDRIELDPTQVDTQPTEDFLSNILDPGDIIDGAGVSDFGDDATELKDDTVDNWHSLVDDTRGNWDSLVEDTQDNLSQVGGEIQDWVSGDGTGGTGEGSAYTPFGEKALDYLMGYEELPRKYRDLAIADLYGMVGDRSTPTYQDLTNDPLYQMQLKAGEEAVLRNAGATGNKYGTDINRTLAANTQNLLSDTYNRQMSDRMNRQNLLSGFAFGQPSKASEIAGLMTDIDRNAAYQKQADAQMEQARMGMLLGGAGSLVGGLANLFSDPKLKKNVTKIGDFKGLDWCTWIWNEAANKLGLYGAGVGVMADQVETKYPHAIGESKGYKTVNYGELINE